MAKVIVNPEELERAALPEGIYPVVIDRCEYGPQAKDPSKFKVFWQFRIEGADDPTANGHVLFANTSTEKGATRNSA